MSFPVPKNPADETMGRRISQARRELGVRLRRDVLQADLADELDVGAATVSRWEADQAVPRDDALARLAAYLGVSPAFLRYGIPLDVSPPVKHDVEAARQRQAAKQSVAKKAAAGDRPGPTRPPKRR